MKGLVFGKTGQLGRSLGSTLGALESVCFVGREQADLDRPDDVERAIESLRPDVVINAAAFTAVDRAQSEPEQAHRVNAEAPGAMARGCARIGAWLIHYSTDYVFDGSASRPYTEDTDTAPLNVYGRTKLAGERAIRDAHDRFLIFRTSWVYSNHGGNFLNTMLRLAGERDELRIVADQTGSPTWAGEIASATGRIVEQLARRQIDADQAGVYHMTCAGRTTWCDFAQRIFTLKGLAEGVRVQPIPSSDFPTPAARPRFSVLSNQRLEQVFSVRLAPWEEALRHCLSERIELQQ